MANPTRTALLTALAAQEAVCAAAAANIATAKRIARECTRRIGLEQQAVKAQREVVRGQAELLEDCRAQVKRLKRELRSLPTD